MKKSLFSVIILHYNQPRYVMKALKSVLEQDYENLELIFADDASTAIELQEIKRYIEKNKSTNLQHVDYVINEQNVGTVKTINRAVQKCNGEHILFFAADDALCNSSVISNFKKAFEQSDENVYMISSQCYMMDIELEKKIGDFVRPTYAANFNKLSAIEQYKVFCKSCFLAIGATAMRREMFAKFGFFNEEYKFVEDWSYFLHLTRNGGTIRYVDFEGLLHRDGGVSHYIDDGELPPHVLAYKYDILRIFENEIFPYVKQFGAKAIMDALNYYADEKKAYKSAGGTDPTMSIIKLTKMFPSFYVQSALFPLTKNWKIVFDLIKGAAYVTLAAMGCALANQMTPEWSDNLFLFAQYILEAVLIIMIYGAFGVVLIKVAFIALRLIKKILRRIKK